METNLDLEQIKNEGLKLIDESKKLVWITIIETASNTTDEEEILSYEKELAVVLNILDMLNNKKDYESIFDYLAGICLEIKSITFAKYVSAKASMLSDEAKNFFQVYGEKIDKKAENVCPYVPSTITNAHIEIKGFAEKEYVPDFIDNITIIEEQNENN